MDDVVLQKLKTDLISTGIFLESDTYQLFNNWGGGSVFSAHREHPYYFGIHPTVINGTVDVMAETTIGRHTELLFVVECKKADPKLKHWVFEPHRPFEERQMPFFLLKRNSETVFTQSYNLPGLGYNTHSDYENCINVFEFSEDRGNLSRTTEKALRAYYGIRQANEAFAGVVDSLDSRSQTVEVRTLVVPIVVTTANLWITKYNPKDINKLTGDIDETKLELEKRNWVIYQYPVPLHESIEGRGLARQNHLIDIVRPDKRPTFIVNTLALPDFVAKLIDDSSNYFPGL